MHISIIFFVCATSIASAIAQPSTTTSIHFTSTPTNLVAGVKQTIGWAGGDGNAVNIVLQQGLASDLKDVPIPPIASGVEGNSTTWTPPKSLPNAGNYALRIEQGPDGINYSGMLQLFGGCSTCPTDAIAAFASSSTATSASKTSPGTGTATTASSHSPTASSGSKKGDVAPVTSGSKTGSSNSTGTAGTSGNSTTTTGSGTNSTMGTGPMANMTMPGANSTANSTVVSSAKLHATSSSSKLPSSSSSSSSSATSSSSSESTSSSTGSSTSPSPTKKSSDGVAVAASNLALILCAIVGIMYSG